MAPEILKCKIDNVPKEYGSKVDLWSIGVVFYFMLTGRYLFGKGSQYLILSQINRITSEIEQGTFFSEFSPDCRDLLSKLLVVDAQRRISWNEFFSHPIFTRSSQESQIQSEQFGMTILRKMQVNQLFQKNSQLEQSMVRTGIRKTTMAGPTHTSDIRGLVQKRKEIKSELVEHISSVNESFRITINQNREYIEVMKSLYNHELNKYVYVTTVAKKVFHFMQNKKCKNIHYTLAEMAFAFLAQKKERLEQIIAGFKQKQNVLKIKNRDLNHVFVKSKESFVYMGYFINLNNYYIYLLDYLKNYLVAKRVKNHPVLPADYNVSKGVKSFQKKLWCLVFYSSTHKEIMQDIILVKRFKLMLYEFLKIMRLSSNFVYKKNGSGSVFNWVKYHHEINSLKINKIQMETLKLENQYLNAG